MEREKYLDDLQEIKTIMNRAKGFLLLSGLSGVSTGIVALIGALTMYLLVFKDHHYLVLGPVELYSVDLNNLISVTAATLILSVIVAVFFTRRKLIIKHQVIWSEKTVQLLINLLIPLVVGGILCVMFLSRGYVGVLPPLTLIFYGLALVNGSKYTVREIRALGIIEIGIGLCAFQFIEYGLIFWALGFGVVQLAYGLIVQHKYT